MLLIELTLRRNLYLVVSFLNKPHYAQTSFYQPARTRFEAFGGIVLSPWIYHQPTIF